MRRAFALLPLMALAACNDAEWESARNGEVIAQDPVVARALHDPLMTDPDLASRNEANAAIGFADSTALPVLAATPEEVGRVREAMRIALLEGGAVPDLPLAWPASKAPVPGLELGPMSGPEELLSAVAAPASCAKALKEDFARAANLPPPAALPPRAMVVQAGGADTKACGLRIVRYLTAAPHEDVLQFHYVTAKRAGLSPERYAVPGDSIVANGKGSERLAVHLRSAANRLTGVTLVYRAP